MVVKGTAQMQTKSFLLIWFNVKYLNIILLGILFFMYSTAYAGGGGEGNDQKKGIGSYMSTRDGHTGERCVMGVGEKRGGSTGDLKKV